MLCKPPDFLMPQHSLWTSSHESQQPRERSLVAHRLPFQILGAAWTAATSPDIQNMRDSRSMSGLGLYETQRALLACIEELTMISNTPISCFDKERWEKRQSPKEQLISNYMRKVQ